VAEVVSAVALEEAAFDVVVGPAAAKRYLRPGGRLIRA